MIAKLQKSEFLNRVEGKKISTESQKKIFQAESHTKKNSNQFQNNKKKFSLQKTKWETRKSNLIILIRESRSVLR